MKYEESCKAWREPRGSRRKNSYYVVIHFVQSKAVALLNRRPVRPIMEGVRDAEIPKKARVEYMDRISYNRHKERGDHRAFLWLSRELHLLPIKAELDEYFNLTGIRIPVQNKLREIVDDYCRARARKRKPVKRRSPVAA